jgi:hypothetical protein
LLTGSRRAPRPKSSELAGVLGSFARRSSPAAAQVSTGSAGRGALGGSATGGGGSGAGTGGEASHPRRSHAPRSQPMGEQRGVTTVFCARVIGGEATSVHVAP